MELPGWQAGWDEDDGAEDASSETSHPRGSGPTASPARPPRLRARARAPLAHPLVAAPRPQPDELCKQPDSAAAFLAQWDAAAVAALLGQVRGAPFLGGGGDIRRALAGPTTPRVALSPSPAALPLPSRCPSALPTW
jgi:hypothetical protein